MKTLVVSAILLLLPALYGFADEFAGEDLSLRLPAGLGRFSSYADVAGKGGASAAGKFGSSENPASIAWSFPATADYGASAQYSNVNFDRGTTLDFFTEVANLDAHWLGSFRFALLQVRSNDSVPRTFPLTFAYDLNLARLDWGKRWGPVSLGLGYSYSDSAAAFRTAKFPMSDTHRHTSTAWGGLLWQFQPKWLLGVVTDFEYGPAHTKALTPTPLGLLESDSHDITREFVVRPGISYEWRENALLQVDYEYVRVWNDTGTLEVHRFRFGGDLPLARFLFVRAGATVDVRGNFGWSTGVGVYPKSGITIDLAYQNDIFAEIQREFGHSRTLNASVSVQF